MATLKNETQFEADTIKYLLMTERGILSAGSALRNIRASLELEMISRAIDKRTAI
jgi:hypothetical protein